TAADAVLRPAPADAMTDTPGVDRSARPAPLPPHAPRAASVDERQLFLFVLLRLRLRQPAELRSESRVVRSSAPAAGPHAASARSAAAASVSSDVVLRCEGAASAARRVPASAVSATAAV